MTGGVNAQGDITAAPVPGAATEADIVEGPQGSDSGTRLMTYALAGDDSGDLAVVWGVGPAPYAAASGPLYGSYALSGQPFQSTPDTIDADVYAGSPIAGSMLASGTAVFASEWESTGAQYVERTRSAGSFPATLTSLPGVSDANDPQLAAVAGQTIVEYLSNGTPGLYSAIAPDGEPFGSPTLLADTGEDYPALADDGDGDAFTAFDEDSTSSNGADLMADTFAADTPTDGSGQGGAPIGGAPSPAPAGTTAAFSPTHAVSATGGAGALGITSLRRLALHLAAALAWFAHERARATLPARCAPASAGTCVFSGRLLAAHWEQRTRAWVTTRIRLGTAAGTLHGSRLGPLTVRLAPAGRTALRHKSVVHAWLSGTLSSAGRRVSVAVPIRLER